MKILREVGLCFCVGGIPMILLALFSGNEVMLNVFSKLSPKDEIVWYLASLLAVYTVIFLIDHYVLKTRQTVVQAMTKKTRRCR